MAKFETIWAPGYKSYKKLINKPSEEFCPKDSIEDYDYRVDTRNEDEFYLDKLQKILSDSPNHGVPHKPSEVYNGVYVGTSADAENLKTLNYLNITHVLNCCGKPGLKREHNRMVNPYTELEPGLCKVWGYMELDIRDNDDFAILPIFHYIYSWIKKARLSGGKVLICSPGVSPAGAIALGYLIYKHQPILKAAKLLKDERRTLLTNVNFMKALIQFAKEEGCLDEKPWKVKTDRSVCGARHRYTVKASVLPDIVVTKRGKQVMLI